MRLSAATGQVILNSAYANAQGALTFERVRHIDVVENDGTLMEQMRALFDDRVTVHVGR